MADFSKLPFPKRLITMDMPDKYMALCFIYEGVQYQNLCRRENPDGTFNYSENCLAQLPFLAPQYLADSALRINSSVVDGSGSSLVKYDPDAQSRMPPKGELLAHYWFEILMALLIVVLMTVIFSSWIKVSNIISKFKTNNKETNKKSLSELDGDGIVTVGKISYKFYESLGIGSKGTCVYKGYYEESQECAVKRIIAQWTNLADREIDFLRSLQHPNLVRYLATEKDYCFIYIALELAEFTLRSVVEGDKLEEIQLKREDICRQAALGLKHLHDLEIVHRDIKPENILISFPKRPNNQRSVMISDFGLSKELSNFDTCHSSSVMRYFDGTQGWMAPEIIKAKIMDANLAPSKAADIFSLGCVFYYIIFKGKHPFGDVLDLRQDNIMSNTNYIDEFRMAKSGGDDGISEVLVVMSNELVRAMVESSPTNRPPIGSILKHPIFWAKKDQLSFLAEVSDRMDKNRDIASLVEQNRHKVIGFDWKKDLSQALQNDLVGPATKHRSYNEKTLRDLLRLIRNKKNHYNDCSEILKQDLGEVPDKFLDYFTSRFPKLMVHVYRAMQPFKEEQKFRDYYDCDESYNF